MKSRYKYPVSEDTRKALRILQEHPGISVRTFAGLYHPDFAKLSRRVGRRPLLSAGRILTGLKTRGYARVRYSPAGKSREATTITKSKAPPQPIYYLTDLGYEICEYYRLIQSESAKETHTV